MARKSKLVGLTAKEKRKVYNQRYYQNKKSGKTRTYTKQHFDEKYAFKTNKTLESKKSVEAYIKQFKKTNAKLLIDANITNPDFLDAKGYKDIDSFKKAINAIFRSAAMRQQKNNIHTEFTMHSNDLILQDIYEQLPPSAQTEIQIEMANPSPRFVGFDWNNSGKYFENDLYIVRINSYSDGSYQEDTMIVERKSELTSEDVED